MEKEQYFRHHRIYFLRIFLADAGGIDSAAEARLGNRCKWHCDGCISCCLGLVHRGDVYRYIRLNRADVGAVFGSMDHPVFPACLL